jgi:hypothetical protein
MCTPSTIQLSAVSANLKQMDVVVVFLLCLLAQESHTVVDCFERLLFDWNLARLAPAFSGFAARSTHAGHASAGRGEGLEVVIAVAGGAL